MKIGKKFILFMLLSFCFFTMAGCKNAKKYQDSVLESPERKIEEGKIEEDWKEEDLEDDKKSPPAKAETETEKPKQEEKTEEDLTGEKRSFYATDTVNVREAPSTDSEIYKKLSRRTEVVGCYFDDAWCEVLIDKQIFYISRDYLREKQDEMENGYVIVLDPGHQKQGNSEKEPVGPGAADSKAKVTGGTAGTTSKVPEYEVNLEVALKLKEELESRGYQVIMTRESNDVDISNAERATIANEANADAFVRIHANGSENPSANGMMAICQTKDNPYNAALYEQSKSLSEYVLEHTVEATGAKKEYVWETDTMTGINWAMVPSTIIEMGYMSNAAEEKLLITEDYQYKLAEGIANGIDAYFAAFAF